MSLQGAVGPTEHPRAAAVELPDLVIDVDDADADMDAYETQRAELQHHLAARQRNVTVKEGAYERRIGELVPGDQPLGGLPAAGGDRLAGRLGGQRLAAVVDVPAGGWVLQVKRARVVV